MTDPVEQQIYRWPRRCLLLLTVIAVVVLTAAAFVL